MAVATLTNEAHSCASMAAVCKSALLGTLNQICGETIQEQADDQAEAPCTGVVGIISFVGDINLTFALDLPQKTAVALAEKFAGFEIPFDSPDMGDVVGELANVIAGDVVAQFDRKRIKVQMSLPLVARGAAVEMLERPNTIWEHIHFQCSLGKFWAKVGMVVKGAPVGRRPGT